MNGYFDDSFVRLDRCVRLWSTISWELDPRFHGSSARAKLRLASA